MLTHNLGSKRQEGLSHPWVHAPNPIPRGLHSPVPPSPIQEPGWYLQGVQRYREHLWDREHQQHPEEEEEEEGEPHRGARSKGDMGWGGGTTYGRARSTSGASGAGGAGVTLGSSIASFAFSTRLAIGTLRESAAR